MKIRDHHLERLLKAAAAAAVENPAERRLAGPGRVAAQWRAAGMEPQWLSLLPLFRAGLACAGLLTLGVVLVSLGLQGRIGADELSLSNALVNVALMR